MEGNCYLYYDDIQDVLLNSPDIPKEFFGYWKLIGGRVLSYDADVSETIKKNVTTMFTTDPIACILMKTLIMHNLDADEFIVSSNLLLSNVSELSKNSEKSEILAADRSSFLVLLDKNFGVNKITIHFWDLKTVFS